MSDTEPQLWHAYGGVDDGSYFIVVVGPVPASEETRAGDREPWSSSWFGEGPYSSDPVIIDFISSFDHDPSHAERKAMVPDDYRDNYRVIDQSSEAEHDVQDDQDEAEGFGVLITGTREHVALCVAVQSRIEDLSRLIEQLTIRGDGARMVASAREQIGALVTVAKELQLTYETWDF